VKRFPRPAYGVLARCSDRVNDVPKSTLGQAVNYFLNDYDALVGYLKDGRLEIDNNLVENDIRPAAVGRKRWLFIGHPDAGWRSAVIYSILGSCRRRGLNPHEYLTDVLARLNPSKRPQRHLFFCRNSFQMLRT